MNAITLNIALPLLTAFLLPIISSHSTSFGRWLGPMALSAMLVIALQHFIAIDTPQMVALGGFLPPMGISFHVDRLALIMLIAIPLLLLLLWPYGKTKAREEALLLLLSAAASGMALSGDLFNIYVFYELLSVASFGLAAANRTAGAFAASFRYVVLSSLGTVLALTGIALIYTQTGTLNLAQIGMLSAQLQNPAGFTAFILIVIGVGVKAELFPMNGWVAEVYSTATARVTSIFAGLVSKLAVLVMVRLLVVAYGNSDVSNLLLVLGMLGILTGELAAWRAQDLRRMFAFSSIGQLGMVLVAFSIPGKAGMIAGVAMMFHHLLVKPALFMFTEQWSGNVERLAGIAKKSPIAVALFILFALSLIGIPPLPGFWAKLLLVTGLVGTESSLHMLALIVLLTGTVIETHYLMRVTKVLVAGTPVPSTRITELGILNISIISIFAGCLFVVLLNLSPIGNQLASIAGESANKLIYISTSFPEFLTTLSAR